MPAHDLGVWLGQVMDTAILPTDPVEHRLPAAGVSRAVNSNRSRRYPKRG